MIEAGNDGGRDEGEHGGDGEKSLESGGMLEAERTDLLPGEVSVKRKLGNSEAFGLSSEINSGAIGRWWA